MMTKVLDKHCKKVADKHDADIFFFSATVNYRNVDRLMMNIRKIENRRKNCILILTTYGGDPDAGYRICRYIRKKYEQFILFIFGSCKSTGTLVALGADEIVMGDFGEFGPLDIQMTKDDELTNTSGLSYLQSLISLNERIFSSFEDNFISLKRKSTFGYSITTKTAAEIGSKLAIGLMQPIADQIDPLKLGEVQRAIKIAEAYGKRVFKGKQENNPVDKLIGEYPSHSFVIDFEETKELFKDTKIKVREPDEDETVIEKDFFNIVRKEGSDDIVYYYDLSEVAEDGEEEENDDTENDSKS